MRERECELVKVGLLLQSHEEVLLAQVRCFGFLCRQIGPTIDVTNRYHSSVPSELQSVKVCVYVRVCVAERRWNSTSLEM